MGAARKPVLPVVAMCCVLVGWLVWACAPALAGRGFASPAVCGSPSALVAPRGLGVDNSASLSKGDVYVVDSGRNVLDKFTAGCELIGEKAIPGAGLYQVAVDEYPGLTEGDVYVVGHSSGVVYRFSPGLVLEKEIMGLSEPTDVAVDQAGNVFVTEYAGSASEGKVLEFNAEGEPVNAESHPDVNNAIVEKVFFPDGVAVNSTGADLYIATLAYHYDAEYAGTVGYNLSDGAYTPTTRFNQNILISWGLTLTSSGDLFVVQEEGSSEYSEVAQYESTSGTLLNRLPTKTLSNQVFGLDFDEETHDLYAADYGNHAIYVFEEGSTPETPETQLAISEPHGFSAILNGELKSGGAGTTGYYFQYGVSGSCEGGTRTTPGTATDGHVQVEVVGLQPRTQYTFCLVATNKYGITVGPGVTFETPVGPPTIEGDSVSPVGTREATANGQINPENTNSSYHLEYGTTSTFQKAPKKTSEVDIGEGNTPVAVGAQLIGLEPNTEYEFRFVATNANNETTLGMEGSFRTLSSGTAALPDKRSYEMVTPIGNDNSDVEVPGVLNSTRGGEEIPTYSPFVATADGSKVTYSTHELSGANGSEGKGDQYLAKRSSTGGWAQSSIQPNGYAGTEYQGFSSDLSVGVLQSGNVGESEILPPLSPQAPGEGYSVLYERLTGENGYRPLITNAVKLNRPPATLEEPPFTEGFGSHEVRTGYGSGSTAFAGASTDFKDLLFEANDALLVGEGALEKELEEDVKGEIRKDEGGNYLYDEVEGRLSLVNVSSGGKVMPNATFGALPIGSHGNPPDFSHVISADGRFVYWTDVASGVVYVREDGSSTVQVSDGAARYWTASSDGRYALYTEGEAKASELYRFAAEPEGGHAQREALTDPNAGVLGVLGASEDGETVYFVAEGVLSGENGGGVAPVAGKPNLYVSSPGDQPVFIGTLSEADGNSVPPFEEGSGEHNWGDWQPGFGQRTARVTGDGGSLVFMSNQSLSVAGYPHGYPSNGYDEVYVYNAASGRLYCASCGSTGETFSRGEGAAAYLPVDWHDTYLPQWISEDGDRVFFDSAEPLVAQDTNGRQDVYEWEREGSGSCVHGDGSTGGCVFLLSGGSSEAASWFVGASETGNDVFVVTRAKLVPEDENDTFDLYDVRVDGVKPVTPPVCTGSGCQGLPAPPPVFATPSSVTFNGVGNFTIPAGEAVRPKSRPLTRAQKLANAVKTCKKRKRRKKRMSCEAQARKLYGVTKKSGRSSGSTLGRKHV